MTFRRILWLGFKHQVDAWTEHLGIFPTLTVSLMVSSDVQRKRNSMCLFAGEKKKKQDTYF